MSKAVHGYQIIERRDGHRINHYRSRPTNDFEVAKVRILALARDIRLKHLSERTFEIWDGVDAICKMVVKKDGHYDIVPYLLQPITFEVRLTNGTIYREMAWQTKNGLDRDRSMANKNRLKKQQVGRVAGDPTAWIKAEPLDKVPCRIVDKTTWSARERSTSRKFGE